MFGLCKVRLKTTQRSMMISSQICLEAVVASMLLKLSKSIINKNIKDLKPQSASRKAHKDSLTVGDSRGRLLSRVLNCWVCPSGQSSKRWKNHSISHSCH